jgi:S-adenosylmethionine:tRNA ribosyltransferase-isomerase
MSSHSPASNCSLPEALEDYQFDLPAELIAQAPLAVRHESRLMQLSRTGGNTSHHVFSDLKDLLVPGDLLVINDTRVIPARLWARRQTGGLVQLLLLRPDTGKSGLWHAMATPLRKLKPGDLLNIENSAAAQIVVKDIIVGLDGQKRLLVDLGSAQEAYDLLAEIGYAPLPPYIARSQDTSARGTDLERYQTVFAQSPGAVAAPTAGLHFSLELLQELKQRGIETANITLHVGPGTFKPITTTLEDHTIESERFTITAATAAAINKALQEKRRIIAVGTTSCRALEAAGASGKVVATDDGQTSLYIRPGYQFRIISGLITNFHLSGSSLLVLVAAFAGRQPVLGAYRQAIEKRYRFFSYGDAMLIV